VILNRSIDGDIYEDWILTRPDQTYWLYRGGILLATIKFAIYKNMCLSQDGLNAGLNMFTAIGDVNGDSIGDLVVNNTSNGIPNCFRILLGIKETSDVSELSSETGSIFTLTDPSPHPLLRGKIAILSINIIKSGDYILELSEVSGKQVAELQRQYLAPGSQNIMFDISNFPVAVGSYILRLRNVAGMVLGQRTIIIE